jgi:PAS domain S-box-containing protein
MQLPSSREYCALPCRMDDIGRNGGAMNEAIALVQEQLGNQELPWQALLDSAGEGIWGVDLDGDCTFVNRAALRMIGFSLEELVGHNMHDMLHHHYTDGEPYPKDESVINDVLWNKKPFANRIDHVFRKDGSMFWAEMSAQPIVVGEEVRGAVVTFRDVTQSRLADEALRRNEKLAAVGQLASSIAHEINNPLEAVINLLYLVRTADTLDEVKTYALLAETELARMADITLQTLRFHRQQTAAGPVDLNDTIPAVLRLYASRLLSRRIALKMRLRDTPTLMLLEGDIRQVLNHLVRNAYDAMPAGGRLYVRLQASSCPGTGEAGVRITVADTGTGFLERMREHLFEPFHTSKDVTGTGLGLWISKGIMDKHLGRISMRSRAQQPDAAGGHGTVFVLWLPLEPAEHQKTAT